MHWFLAVSLLLISIVFSLLSFRLEFSAAISEQLILSISELSAILAICAFVMISSTVATRKAYLSSFVVLFILTVMHGAYFVLLGSMLFLYFRAAYEGNVKKTFYLFFYLSFLYLIQKIGFSDAYSDIFKNGGVILLLVTDYEGDVEYPSFLFLALHGSYQELERILKKRVGLYGEHAETTVDSVKFKNYNRATETCYEDTGTEGMTSNACEEVTTQPTAMLLDRGKRVRLSRRSAFHKSRRRRNPHGRRRRRVRYTG